MLGVLRRSLRSPPLCQHARLGTGREPLLPCQLDAGWQDNLTTMSPRSASPDLHVATERKATRGLEEIAALFFMLNSTVPSAATATRIHSQKLIRKGIGPARALPQQDFMLMIPVWSTSTSTLARSSMRCVNRVHLDSSNGLLAILPVLLVQLVPVLVPIVAGLGPRGFP